MMLDQKEKERFADWLEHDANQLEQLAKQMDVIGLQDMAQLAKQYRIEMMAQRVVARKLRGMELQTVG